MQVGSFVKLVLFGKEARYQLAPGGSNVSIDDFTKKLMAIATEMISKVNFLSVNYTQCSLMTPAERPSRTERRH